MTKAATGNLDVAKWNMFYGDIDKDRKMNYETLDIYKRITTVFISLLCLFGTVVADAASIGVVREEFPVNEIATRENQDHATLSMNQTGEFMVTWDSSGGYDGDGASVFARSFDSNGLSIMDEFIINSSGLNQQRVPDIESDGTGHFVIVWTSGSDIAGYDVYAKIVTLTGTVVVSDFKINVTTSAVKNWPDVAMFPNGDFIVIWDQVELGAMNYYVRLYNLLGSPLTSPVKINEITSDSPQNNNGYGLPDIAVNDVGKAVAVWERLTGTSIVVAGRLFEPYTMRTSKEALISLPPVNTNQRRPMVDINNAGDIVVTWIEHPAGNPTAGDVYLRKYDGFTSSWGDRITPHANKNLNQHRSVLKLTESGDFVIAWTGEDPVYSDDVFIRFYKSNVIPASKEIMVNLTRADKQRRPAIALSEQANQILMSVTWESMNQDGSGFGIYGKLYRILP